MTICYRHTKRAVLISTHTLTWSVTNPSMIAPIISGNFNSHAHVERDSGVTFIFNQNIDFNSHAHVERDTAVILPLER